MIWWRWTISVSQLWCCCWSAWKRRKRPNLFANNSRILYHDCAPAHTARSVWSFLASKQITVLEHPPLSQDQGSNAFCLFLKIKKILKWRHFDDIDDGSSEGHSTKPVPKLHWRVDWALASVHTFPKGVLWRRPQQYSAMWYLPRRVRERYCQTTITTSFQHRKILYYQQGGNFLSTTRPMTDDHLQKDLFVNMLETTSTIHYNVLKPSKNY
jgi:hypothetical protein